MADYFNSSTDLSTYTTSTGSQKFFLSKRIQQINTIILAEVLSVDNSSKRLSVKSLINGVATDKTPIDPPIIYNVPYGSVRGGSAGIITEFKPGDTVIVGFCQRQIDAVKRTGARSTPNLLRFHALNDAVVLSHWSNNDPNIFIKVTDDGIEIQGVGQPIQITTTGDVTINSKNVNINATEKVTITAPEIDLNGEVKAEELTIGEIPFLLHTHGGVTSGTDLTGGVTP